MNSPTMNECPALHGFDDHLADVAFARTSRQHDNTSPSGIFPSRKGLRLKTVRGFSQTARQLERTIRRRSVVIRYFVLLKLLDRRAVMMRLRAPTIDARIPLKVRRRLKAWGRVVQDEGT